MNNALPGGKKGLPGGISTRAEKKEDLTPGADLVWNQLDIFVRDISQDA